VAHKERWGQEKGGQGGKARCREERACVRERTMWLVMLEREWEIWEARASEILRERACTAH
jgi:hypothetical protein